MQAILLINCPENDCPENASNLTHQLKAASLRKKMKWSNKGYNQVHAKFVTVPRYMQISSTHKTFHHKLENCSTPPLKAVSFRIVTVPRYMQISSVHKTFHHKLKNCSTPPLKAASFRKQVVYQKPAYTKILCHDKVHMQISSIHKTFHQNSLS